MHFLCRVAVAKGDRKQEKLANGTEISFLLILQGNHFQII